MMVGSNKNQIVILGAAGTGLLMAESISRNREITLLGFLDDDAEKQSRGYNNLPVLGKLSSWESLPRECLFLTSLYGPKKNYQFFKVVKSLGIPRSRWATVIDLHAVVSNKAILGYGTFIGPGTVLEPMVHLGNLCAILGNVYIAHDSHLADYVVCANSASIAGGVSIGSAAYIGANASIREYIKIGPRSIIGMGSVVLNDVPNDTIVVGNPARVMKKHSD